MPKVIAIVGPTATGKSALALDVAERVGGAVVNADSMQLYRGMDIGTAKLSLAERRGIPHHLLDIWEVTETASVADYQARARAQIDALLERGTTPVLVGGSGLYVRSVLDPIEFPGTDADVRGGLESELEAVGAPVLHRRLAGLDPAAASAIAPENARKIVRALEVIALTGQPFTAALPAYDDPRYDAVQIGLDLPTEELDRRIGQRVAAMVDAGLLEEVRRLEAVGLRAGVTASRALGYAQMLAVVDGVLTLDEAVAVTAQATRRFVRRQRSWFRRDPRIQWSEPASDLAGRVIALSTR
ncbi:MAG TPA: tRNA (adenosine(37)-N6)-dimethylallyltransferase MiaA [Mycobacteriales bacterium]|nr:tRNA (adenosine(37)-N6)-dimethylallyltransferase MiaA [Mycobacteriales bacterium]